MRISSRLLAGTLSLALLLALPLTSGCDTGTPGPVMGDLGIRVSTFTPRANQFEINSDGDIATYVRETNQLTPAVVNEGVVLLYARGDLVVVGGQNTWQALPYTQGIEAEGPDFPYVDFTITYSYAFEPGFLYLDVITSAPGLFHDDFWADRYIPDHIPFRLVTIPPGAPMIQGLDYSDYQAVVEAYGIDE